jgi:sec-independent protein translocase protein TatB
VFDIGAGEFIGLALLGLLLFGPDRLPAIAGDVARAVRKLRSFASSATTELKENLGPELTSLNDLRPQRIASDFGKSLLDPDTQRKEARIDPDAT